MYHIIYFILDKIEKFIQNQLKKIILGQFENKKGLHAFLKTLKYLSLVVHLKLTLCYIYYINFNIYINLTKISKSIDKTEVKG